jgi:hypothetical protein
MENATISNGHLREPSFQLNTRACFDRSPIRKVFGKIPQVIEVALELKLESVDAGLERYFERPVSSKGVPFDRSDDALCPRSIMFH